MKKKVLFLGVTFFTLTFWQWSYYRFTQHFNGLPEAEHQIAQLEHELAAEKAVVSLLDYRLADFKESVAQVMPEFQQPAYSEQEVKVRGLASVVRQNENPKIKAVSLDEKIDKAAEFYAQSEYEKAISLLSPVMKDEVLAASAVRGYFILAESYFQLQSYPECLAQIRVMVEQFPDHEMTGYLLLRMGQIFAEQRRVDEAHETFMVVSKSFPDAKLKAKAILLASQVKGELVE